MKLLSISLLVAIHLVIVVNCRQPIFERSFLNDAVVTPPDFDTSMIKLSDIVTIFKARRWKSLIRMSNTIPIYQIFKCNLSFYM